MHYANRDPSNTTQRVWQGSLCGCNARAHRSKELVAAEVDASDRLELLLRPGTQQACRIKVDAAAAACSAFQVERQEEAVPWARVVDQELHQPQRALRIQESMCSIVGARARAQVCVGAVGLRERMCMCVSVCVLGRWARTALAKGPGSKPPPRPHAQLSDDEAACSVCASSSIDAIGT